MMMNSSKSILKSALTVATLALVLAPSAAFASTVHITPSMHAFFGNKEKTVNFKLANRTSAPIELKVGDQVMTVAAGETKALKLAAGTQVINTTKSDKREAGAVVCQVSSALSDSTVVLN